MSTDPQVFARLRAIEVRLDEVVTHLGLPLPPLTPGKELPPAIVELARAGHTIEAVKQYRQLTNCSLVEAKQIIDALG